MFPHTRRKPSTFDGNLKISEAWTQLVVSEINSLTGGFREAYLQRELLSKFVSKDTDSPVVRQTRAISKWLATERENEATNARLINTRPDFEIIRGVTWARFIAKFQSVVLDIVGSEVPPIEALIGAFSGGATTSKSRTESHPASKYLGKAHITSAATPWFDIAMDAMPGWSRYNSGLDITEVPGNVMFTVPKTTTIDRVCCKEPDLNMFLQKGVGNFLRSRLRSVGINLNDQSRNKRLAQRGSSDGSLATLDLSSASDSISRELVWIALPTMWFGLLDSIRCHQTFVDGEYHVNEMFSSMGNGFTFELESLLFYSIAKTCAYFEGVRGVISVYGDDIIVPSALYDNLTWVLNWLGFAVNADKSFHTGPFRESCGGHYYNGCDVTPFYLRAPMERLTDLIRVGNQIRRWSEQLSVGSILDTQLEELWCLIRDEIPRKFWGGRELGSITQLVTDGLPLQQLVAMKGKPKETNLGGLIFWLNSTNGRVESGLPVETSEVTVTRTRYRARPVLKTGFRHLDYVFMTELGDVRGIAPEKGLSTG